jgi:glycine betaine/proline transport system substrate-binding protein
MFGNLREKETMLNTIKRGSMALAIIAIAICAKPGTTSATECGTSDKITIAEMTWLSSSVLAMITQRILKDGYGCNAETTPGDTVPTATSMLTKNRPDIAPELWISTASTIWNKIKEKGNVYKAGDIFSGGGKEGWWIPDYVAKANPGLKSITDLEKFPKLFADVSNPDKGRLYGCPPGWGCEIITNNLFKALGLGKSFELFSPGSGANLKASIARKVTQKKPILAYYWGPTAVIGKFNLVRLGMPQFDDKKFTCLTNKDCKNPQVSGWKPGDVAVAVVTTLRDKAPNVAAFLGKLQVPNATVNKILAWADDNKASSEDAAVRFLKTEQAVWTKWVPADVAKNVKASL